MVSTNTQISAKNQIETLVKQGAMIVVDGEKHEVSIKAYRDVVKRCENEGFDAICYDLIIPNTPEQLMIAIHRDGQVDVGSVKRICDCLAARI